LGAGAALKNMYADSFFLHEEKNSRPWSSTGPAAIIKTIIKE